jgi:hypothetical protein
MTHNISEIKAGTTGIGIVLQEDVVSEVLRSDCEYCKI